MAVCFLFVHSRGVIFPLVSSSTHADSYSKTNTAATTKTAVHSAFDTSVKTERSHSLPNETAAPNFGFRPVLPYHTAHKKKPTLLARTTTLRPF